MIEINNSAAGFGRKCIEHDLKKDTFNYFDRHQPLIIDLIDERFRLAQLPDGRLYTWSASAAKHTNMRKLASHLIEPICSERSKMMAYSLMKSADVLNEFDTVIIHRALFDENFGSWRINIADLNAWLSVLYDQLARRVPHAHSIEAPNWLRRYSKTHIWGEAPMHFVDEYYIHALRRFCNIFDGPIQINPITTLQKR